MYYASALVLPRAMVNQSLERDGRRRQARMLDTGDGLEVDRTQ